MTSRTRFAGFGEGCSTGFRLGATRGILAVVLHSPKHPVPQEIGQVGARPPQASYYHGMNGDGSLLQSLKNLDDAITGGGPPKVCTQQTIASSTAP